MAALTWTARTLAVDRGHLVGTVVLRDGGCCPTSSRISEDEMLMFYAPAGVESDPTPPAALS